MSTHRRFTRGCSARELTDGDRPLSSVLLVPRGWPKFVGVGNGRQRRETNDPCDQSDAGWARRQVFFQQESFALPKAAINVGRQYLGVGTAHRWPDSGPEHSAYCDFRSARVTPNARPAWK